MLASCSEKQEPECTVDVNDGEEEDGQGKDFQMVESVRKADNYLYIARQHVSISQ